MRKETEKIEGGLGDLFKRQTFHGSLIKPSELIIVQSKIKLNCIPFKMKKLFSFTLFMVIIVLALIARSTATAGAIDNTYLRIVCP